MIIFKCCSISPSPPPSPGAPRLSPPVEPALHADTLMRMQAQLDRLEGLQDEMLAQQRRLLQRLPQERPQPQLQQDERHWSSSEEEGDQRHLQEWEQHTRGGREQRQHDRPYRRHYREEYRSRSSW